MTCAGEIALQEKERNKKGADTWELFLKTKNKRVIRAPGLEEGEEKKRTKELRNWIATSVTREISKALYQTILNHRQTDVVITKIIQHTKVSLATPTF